MKWPCKRVNPRSVPPEAAQQRLPASLQAAAPGLRCSAAAPAALSPRLAPLPPPAPWPHPPG